MNWATTQAVAGPPDPAAARNTCVSRPELPQKHDGTSTKDLAYLSYEHAEVSRRCCQIAGLSGLEGERLHLHPVVTAGELGICAGILAEEN